MRRFGIGTLAGAAMATVLMAGAAHAGQSVNYYSYGNGVPHPPNLIEVDKFSSDTAGTSPTLADRPTAITNFLWSGPTLASSGFIADATNGNGAEPASGPATHFRGNYLTIEGGHSETLTFGAPVSDKYMTFYMGSLDAYNTVSFKLDGVLNPVVFTGDGHGGTISLGAISGANNGNQSIADTNGVFTFLFTNAIRSVTFSSTQNSFEIENVFAAPTPEPETWVLMLLGVGLMGSALRMSRKSAGLAAA